MNPRRTRSPRAVWLLALLAFVLVAGACGQGELPQDTLSNLKGPDARNVDRLWDLVFPIATVIFFLVQGLIVFVIFKFRAKSDDDQPVQVHGNAKAEIGWTIDPRQAGQGYGSGPKAIPGFPPAGPWYRTAGPCCARSAAG